MSRQLKHRDYDRFDLLIGMDKANIRNMHRICGGDCGGKIHLLLEYAGRPGGEVADPWYTGDFEAAWRDILAGASGFFAEIGDAAMFGRRKKQMAAPFWIEKGAVV